MPVALSPHFGLAVIPKAKLSEDLIMNNMIKITQTQINGSDVNSVNARELHQILEIKKAFTTWINTSLENAGAIEGEDFLKLKSSLEGSGYKFDYIITTDISKHISMMSKVPKAKNVRDYFIKCEKELQEQQKFSIPQTYADALRLSADLAEQNIQLTQTIKNKDNVILAVADLNIKAGNVSFADFAKNLAIENMGRNNVIKFCKARGYLRDNTEPYQPFVNRGYFVRKPSKEKINGEVRYTTFLTPRGTVWLTKIIKAEFEIDDEEVA